jgi:putative membrane protein
MFANKIGFCGALCSVLVALAACSHDNTQATTPQAAYNPPPATNNMPPSETQPMMNGYQPAVPPGAANVQTYGSNTGLGNTTGQPMPGQPGMNSGTYPGTMTGATGTTSADQATMQLNDDDILAIMDTINKGEIQVSQLARSRAMTTDAKNLANMIFSDHTTALQQDNTLAQNQHITPNMSNNTVQMMTSDMRQSMDSLQQKTGKDFDRQFIDDMIRGHQKVLSLINDSLLPNVKDPMLKAQLQSMKTHIEMHLRHAQDAQQAMGTGTNPSSQMPPGQTNTMPNQNNAVTGSGSAHP